MEMFKATNWHAVGIGAFVGAMVLLTGLALSGNYELVLGLMSERTAAWVQAIGSILAILTAVWLSTSQRNAENQRRTEAERLAACSLATAYIRSVKALHRRLHAEAEYMEGLKPNCTEWSVNSSEIPQRLWGAIPVMPSLGLAGGEILQAIYHAMESRELISHDNKVTQGRLIEYRGHVLQARNHAERAVRLLHEILK